MAANKNENQNMETSQLQNNGLATPSLFDTCQERDKNLHSAVIACGYRKIRSPKTGFTFPAWLLKLPTKLNVEEDSNSKKDSHDESCCSLKRRKIVQKKTVPSELDEKEEERQERHPRNHVVVYSYVWRSKRDFLLLSRAAAKYGRQYSKNNSDKEWKNGKCKTLIRQYPKAAFDKLSRHATDKHPWRRPLSQEDSENNEDELSNTNCLSNKQNSYHVSMKKSLLQLDQFIRSIEVECSWLPRATTGSYSDNLKDSDTATIPTSAAKTTNTIDDDSFVKLKEAWDVFCRPQNTNDLFGEEEERVSITNNISSPSSNNDSIDCTDKSVNNVLDPTVVQPTSVEDSSRLGQYFCTRENAKHLVEAALKQVKLELSLFERKKVNAQQRTQTKATVCSSIELVFLEPSCGNGDVIHELIQQLQSFTISSHDNNADGGNSNKKNGTTVTYKIRIIGCDIDPFSIQSCRERFGTPTITDDNKANMKKSDTSTTDFDQCKTKKTTEKRQRDQVLEYNLEWICQDFLTTNPSKDILGCDEDLKTDETVNDGVGVESSLSIATRRIVCCVGGPPYTTGAGSGSNFQTDLPQLFLWHCIHVWKAQFVSFLVPQRYQTNPMKVKKKLGSSNKEKEEGQEQGAISITTTSIDNGSDNMSVNMDDNNVPTAEAQEEEWICETQNLSSSTFYFQGKTPVVQPSVLQCFYRRPAWSLYGR